MNLGKYLPRWLTAVAAAFVLAGPAAAAASEVLVSTDWLEKNLQNPKVRVIEVSVNPGLFERGHISGAVNFSWHTDLSTPWSATWWARTPSSRCCARRA